MGADELRDPLYRLLFTFEETTWDRVGYSSDSTRAAETIQLSIEVVRQMAG